MKTGNNIETASNSPAPGNGGVTIKSEQELEAMRRAGAVVAATLAVLRDAVVPGSRTKDLDAVAARQIRHMGAIPTFKGYRGFPGNICVSVNQEIVHGIPGNRVIQEGDLVKMDVGATIDGFIGDAAITVGAGKVSPEALDLIEVTRLALEEGIKASVDGGRLGDIGAAVQGFAEGHGYSVVKEYVGHGIGRRLHEEPQVANYGEAGMGMLLRSGMTIAIEPMVNVGDWRTRLLADNWTVVTADGKLSAHFEHTIAIRDGVAEVMTALR